VYKEPNAQVSVAKDKPESKIRNHEITQMIVKNHTYTSKLTIKPITVNRANRLPKKVMITTTKVQ
jgi:hypothetical protein